MDKKTIQKKLNTLACVVFGLIGKRTTFELFNDAFVIGNIVYADAMMNVDLTHVRYTDANGKFYSMDNFHIAGRKIRYVQIPDNVDVISLIEDQMPKKRKARPTTLKEKIITKKDKQTMKRFKRQQNE